MKLPETSLSGITIFKQLTFQCYLSRRNTHLMSNLIRFTFEISNVKISVGVVFFFHIYIHAKQLIMENSQ